MSVAIVTRHKCSHGLICTTCLQLVVCGLPRLALLAFECTPVVLREIVVTRESLLVTLLRLGNGHTIGTSRPQFLGWQSCQRRSLYPLIANVIPQNIIVGMTYIKPQ